jgi:alpha-beta hydrolase superfamily lysophospholipase
MIRGRVALSTMGIALAGLLALLACCLAATPDLAVPAGALPARFPRPDLIFRMHDGLVLPARLWEPPSNTPPAGIILALHGFTDSRDAWELPAPVFAKAGYTVIAPDLRGFGATATRGVWPGQEALIGDAAELAAQLRARFKGQFLVMMGESMGSAVIMCLAARSPATADAYVLTSPAVWGRGQMAFTLTGALWAANHVAPGWRLTGREIPLDIAACDNREALIRLNRDPLTLHGSTVAMLSGLVDLMTAAHAAAAHLPPQTIVLNGRRDQVVPPAAAAAAWSKMPSQVRRAFYLNGYHLLLRDLDRDLVEADILSWLSDPHRWLPSGADINASTWQSDHGWVGYAPSGLPATAADGAGLRRIWPF